MPEYTLNQGGNKSRKRFARLSPFTRAYIECAFFVDDPVRQDEEGSDTGRDGSLDDLSQPAWTKLIRDARDFERRHQEAIACNPEYAGHDLWLTRNGHGAGFWDRPDDTYGTPEARDAMDASAESLGPVYMYLGDDGRIYVA